MAIAYDYGAGVSMSSQQHAANSDSDDNDKKAFSSEEEYGRRSFLSLSELVLETLLVD